MSDFNLQIIDEFRANAGQVGGMFEGADLLLLTTVGARSGRSRTSPVGFARDGRRILVFGSNAGQPNHPDWYHNLVANPNVTVEVGTETFDAIAVVLRGEERDRHYAAQGERVPAYAAYQAQTGRVIPVVAVYPVVDALSVEGVARAGAIGEELVRIHEELRRELLAVRTGARHSAVNLAQHCLAFCGSLHAHHTQEDAAFSRIERQLPELAPLLARLRREHGLVAERIRRLRALLDADGAVDGEIETLAAELESHFAYEEEQLVPVLNKLGPGRPL